MGGSIGEVAEWLSGEVAKWQGKDLARATSFFRHRESVGVWIG
jgi:hypothetical protein